MKYLLKAMLKDRFTFLFIVFGPIILYVIGTQVMGNQINSVKVPVVLVDPYNQEFTDQLLNDMENQESFELIRTDEIPKNALDKGEVEAIFVLPENLKEQVLQGKLERKIEWYRNERSLFDGLFKEQLASTIMKYLVRAEAANIVVQYDGDENWQDVYQFGRKYFEPKPLFQMSFKNFSGNEINTHNDDSNLMKLAIWLYIWILLSFLTKQLLSWKSQNILERTKVISKTRTVWLSWSFLTLIISGFVSAILLTLLRISLQMSLEQMIYDYLIILTTVMFFILISIVVKKKTALWLVSLTYGVASTIIFFLIQFHMLPEAKWMYLFLSSWFLT